MRSAAMSSMAFTLVGRGAAVVAPRGALRLPPRRYSADGKPRANQPAGAVRTGLEPAGERLHSLAPIAPARGRLHTPNANALPAAATNRSAAAISAMRERGQPCAKARSPAAERLDAELAAVGARPLARRRQRGVRAGRAPGRSCHLQLDRARQVAHGDRRVALGCGQPVLEDPVRSVPFGPKD